jgi:hypothetical protein
MEIDEMFSSSLDMEAIWEFDILFLELDPIFFIYPLTDLMLGESTEYLAIFSLEREYDSLSFEHFLYFERFFESFSRLIF